MMREKQWGGGKRVFTRSPNAVGVKKTSKPNKACLFLYVKRSLAQFKSDR